MGYRTYYCLDIEKDKDHEILDQFREEYENARYALDERGSAINDTSWYNHEDELKEFSKKYPDRLFTMWGEGASSDDLWKLYVKNGKSQDAPAEITYDEFDESKLV